MLISVYPDPVIEGLPEIIEEGTTAEVTCTVQGRKPKSTDFYWTLVEVKINGSLI